MTKFSVPILLVSFNRPEQTSKVLRLISQISPVRLYIANDGPREGNSMDVSSTCEIRSWASSPIHFFQSTDTLINTLFHPTNMGCRAAYNAAMAWFFASESFGIVLEDDTLPELSFFPYAENLLLKYENDTRIGSICAYTHFSVADQSSYRFSKIPHVWGFATWRRVHNKYINDLASVDDSLLLQLIANAVPGSQVRRWLTLFQSTASGATDTWCHAWVLTHFANSLLAIVPNVQLVTNLGFGSLSTHTDTCIQSL